MTRRALESRQRARIERTAQSFSRNCGQSRLPISMDKLPELRNSNGDGTMVEQRMQIAAASSIVNFGREMEGIISRWVEAVIRRMCSWAHCSPAAPADQPRAAESAHIARNVSRLYLVRKYFSGQLNLPWRVGGVGLREVAGSS